MLQIHHALNSTQSLLSQLESLRLKYAAFQQQSNILALKEQELTREVHRLESENDDLRSEYKECERQNSEKSQLLALLKSENDALLSEFEEYERRNPEKSQLGRAADDLVQDLSVDLHSFQQQTVALKAPRTARKQDVDEKECDGSALMNVQIKTPIKWRNIACCVEHEMYSKLGSVLRSIVSEKGREDEDIDAKAVQSVTEILRTRRKLVVEERAYFGKLVERALAAPIASHNVNAEQQRLQSNSAVLASVSRLQDVSAATLDDIYAVRRMFVWCHYHFAEYAPQRFVADMTRESMKWSESEQAALFTLSFAQTPSFFARQLIADDMLEIIDVIASASRFAEALRVDSDLDHFPSN